MNRQIILIILLLICFISVAAPKADTTTVNRDSSASASSRDTIPAALDTVSHKPITKQTAIAKTDSGPDSAALAKLSDSLTSVQTGFRNEFLK
jgi:hypothetical protein